jgi:hypothetical protein
MPSYSYQPPVVTAPSTRNYRIDNPTAGTRISIGSGTSIFANKVLFSAFDGEATFSLNLPMGSFTSVSLAGTGAASSITTQNTNYSITYKPVAPKDGFNDLGGFDWIFVARRKLATVPHSFTFTLGDKLACAGFVQPPLSMEYTVGQPIFPDGPIIKAVNDTDVVGVDNVTYVHRPDYAVNSVAFYIDGKSGDYTALGGKNYKAGKIGQLYRLKATDSSSVPKTAWLDWSMPTLTQVVLTDTTGFLNTGTYPITIAPVGDTFGYTGAGSGYSGNGAGQFFASGDRYTGAAGTGVSMSMWCIGGASNYVQMGIYTYTSALNGSLLTNGNTGSASVSQYSKAQSTANFASGPTTSAVAYYLVGQFQKSSNCYYDSGATNKYCYASGTFGTWPSTLTFSEAPVKYWFTIYVTYTPAATGWANVKNIRMGTGTVLATDVSHIWMGTTAIAVADIAEFPVGVAV